jgi:hypothetical protein
MSVISSDEPARRFLVEWYQAGLACAPPADTAARLAAGAAAARADGLTVSVVLTLAAPGDDTLFGVFCADTAETVRQICDQAGCPPDRITGDIRTFVTPGGDPGGD